MWGLRPWKVGKKSLSQEALRLVFRVRALRRDRRWDRSTLVRSGGRQGATLRLCGGGERRKWRGGGRTRYAAIVVLHWIRAGGVSYEAAATGETLRDGIYMDNSDMENFGQAMCIECRQS